MSQLGELAESIFSSEFDSDIATTNATLILAWLTENLGLLNTLINSSFSGVDPGLKLEEIAIYKQIYLTNYYSKQARNALRGIMSTTSSDNILLVADAGNRIQFTNKNEVSKTYRDLAKDSKELLDSLIYKYNLYASKPLQVVGIEAGSYDAGEEHNENDEAHEDDILDGGED